jgi:nitrilase
MYSQGVQIYCAPTADDRDTWQATMRHVAVEGRCFVLACNQFARRSDYPADYPAALGSDPQTVMSRGGSVVISPLGQILAGPLFDEPGILTAELDLADVVRGKYDLDVVGHYARPDIFRLEVDERPRPAVAPARRSQEGSEDDTTEFVRVAPEPPTQRVTVEEGA